MFFLDLGVEGMMLFRLLSFLRTLFLALDLVNMVEILERNCW